MIHSIICCSGIQHAYAVLYLRSINDLKIKLRPACMKRGRKNCYLNKNGWPPEDYKFIFHERSLMFTCMCFAVKGCKDFSWVCCASSVPFVSSGFPANIHSRRRDPVSAFFLNIRLKLQTVPVSSMTCEQNFFLHHWREFALKLQLLFRAMQFR